MIIWRWYVFPCNVERGCDDDGPPQTCWDGTFRCSDSWQDAYDRARYLVNSGGYDFAAVMEKIEGKGLELNCTFGYRPAENDADLPGTIAEAFSLLDKWNAAALANVKSKSIKE